MGRAGAARFAPVIFRARRRRRFIAMRLVVLVCQYHATARTAPVVSQTHRPPRILSRGGRGGLLGVELGPLGRGAPEGTLQSLVGELRHRRGRALGVAVLHRS